VLQALGIEDLFEGIIDVWAMFYIPKPELWTYFNAQAIVGVSDPRRCVFVDDTLKNLKPPKELGWTTILVDSRLSHSDAAYSIPCLHMLPQILPTIPMGFQKRMELFPQQAQLVDG
jgi:FMN phosphatase YigB (HAD superfamily)